MTKTHACLSIDQEVFNIAKRKYPLMISKMFEEYLRSLINADIPDIEKKKIDDLEEIKQDMEQQMSQQKLKLETITQQLKKEHERIKQDKKKEDDKSTKLVHGIINSGLLRKVGQRR